jgi:hypothetical protein
VAEMLVMILIVDQLIASAIEEVHYPDHQHRDIYFNHFFIFFTTSSVE